MIIRNGIKEKRNQGGQSVEITLTGNMKSRMLHYAVRSTDSGHWGDGVPLVPEEAALMEKVRNATDLLDISPKEGVILGRWMSDVTRNGRVVAAEDAQIAAALEPPLETYYRRLKDHYRSELQELEELTWLLSRMQGGKTPADELVGSDPAFSEAKLQPAVCPEPPACVEVAEKEGVCNKIGKMFSGKKK